MCNSRIEKRQDIIMLLYICQFVYTFSPSYDQCIFLHNIARMFNAVMNRHAYLITGTDPLHDLSIS